MGKEWHLLEIMASVLHELFVIFCAQFELLNHWFSDGLLQYLVLPVNTLPWQTTVLCPFKSLVRQSRVKNLAIEAPSFGFTGSSGCAAA